MKGAKNTPALNAETAFKVQIKKSQRYTNLYYLQIFNEIYCSGILKISKRYYPKKLFLVMAQQGLIHSCHPVKFSALYSGDFMIRDVQNANLLRLTEKGEIITAP